MAKKGRTTSKARLRATDISGIESGLATLRKEQITIGAAVNEQPDAALFFVDQAGVSDAKAIKKLKERGLLLKRPLRIDEILKPQSKIPAISSNRVASKGEKHILDRRVKAMTAEAVGNKPKAPTKKDDGIHDPWSVESKTPKPSFRRSAPVVSVRAVKVPVGGASYRPDPTQHAQLVKEVDEIKQRQTQETERFKDKVSVILNASNVNDVDLLTDEQMGFTEETPSDPDAPTDGSPIVSLPRKKSVKKRKWQRNKEQKKKTRLTHLAIQARADEEASQLERVKSLAKLVKREAEERQAALGVRKRSRPTKENHLSKLNHLGKFAFAPAPLVVTPTEQMGECLRRVKTEGNLVVDRFKSFQERALIEPRRTSGPTKGKKKAVKMVEPYSHRNLAQHRS